MVHHHIINDRFGNRTVALTYCAMCRTVIPFDVTDIGPLFVGSFTNANMIVAAGGTVWDARGKYKSGRKHPDLEMLALSDEYWFSWKAFHPDSRLVRVQ